MRGSQMSELVREAEAFLGAHWKSDNDLSAWRELVVDSNWAALRWPTQWFGRGLDDDAATEIENVFRAAGAPRGPVSDNAQQEAYNDGLGTARSLGRDDSAHCPYPRGSPLRPHWLDGFKAGGGRVV